MPIAEASAVVGAFKTAKAMVEVGDPSLTKDLRKVLGLVTTWEETEGEREQAEVDLIQGITERLGDLEGKIQGLAELGCRTTGRSGGEDTGTRRTRLHEGQARRTRADDSCEGRLSGRCQR